MQTTLKLQAISALKQNFYPAHTIDRFKKLSNYGAKCPWVKELQMRKLKTYIECLDVTFCGHPDCYLPKQREMLLKNDISPRKLECFHLLNRVLLEDTINEVQNECLLKYYRLLLRLNDGTAIFERDNLKGIAHKYEAKIIHHFARAEALDKNALGRFLLISALFSDKNFSHEEDAIAEFLDICARWSK